MSNGGKRKFLSDEEILAQSKGAEASSGSGSRAPFLSPGRYVLRVGRTQAYTSRKGKSIRQITFRVVRVLPCEPRPFQHGVLVEPLKLGQEATHMIQRDDTYPSYFDNETKDFAVAAAWGNKGVTAQDITGLFSGEQLAENALLIANVLPNVEADTPKDKRWTKVYFDDGRMPAAEFAKALSADDKKILFTEGQLEAMIALEAEQAAAGFGPAPKA